jgi:hypothetical protein
VKAFSHHRLLHCLRFVFLLNELTVSICLLCLLAPSGGSVTSGDFARCTNPVESAYDNGHDRRYACLVTTLRITTSPIRLARLSFDLQSISANPRTDAVILRRYNPTVFHDLLLDDLTGDIPVFQILHNGGSRHPLQPQRLFLRWPVWRRMGTRSSPQVRGSLEGQAHERPALLHSKPLAST